MGVPPLDQLSGSRFPPSLSCFLLLVMSLCPLLFHCVQLGPRDQVPRACGVSAKGSVVRTPKPSPVRRWEVACEQLDPQPSCLRPSVGLVSLVTHLTLCIPMTAS